MTEDEWRGCDDPIAMVEYLRGSPVGEESANWTNSRWRLDPATGLDRRLRLFACASCRRLWDRIPEACNRAAVEAVEDHTDGRLTGAGLQEAVRASSAVEWMADGSGRRQEPGYWAVKYLGRGFYKLTPGASGLMVLSTSLFGGPDEYSREARYQFAVSFDVHSGVFLQPFRWPLPVPDVVAAERNAQAALVRCVFPNPFKPVALDRQWRTSAVTSLATAMYESRCFDAAPILADALEEAGCGDEEILGHLRGPGPHVRACWAVDLALGKS